MSGTEEKVEIYIQEDMDVAKRSCLLSALEHEKGIVSVWFAHGNDHCLTVHFKHKHCSHITLIDTINEHGYHGKIIDD